MKKGVLRVLAGFLAVMLAFSSGSTAVYAEEISAEISAGEDSPAEEEEIGQEDTEPEQAAEEKVTIQGSVEVQVISGIEVLSDQTFTVTLSGPQSYSSELTLSGRTKEEPSAPRASVRFAGVAEGEYDLTVSGAGYVNYTQHITVAKLGYRVQLYTGKAALTDKSAKPGVLPYGDVNGDGKLDDQDSARIVDAIDGGAQEGFCDLNGDGAVDLLDLNYFTDLVAQKEQASTLEKLLPAEAAEAVLHEETLMAGGSSSLEEMMAGTGTLVLAPQAGGAITEVNSVAVGFDFEHCQDPMMMEGMVVKCPEGSDNGITGGQVAVLYEENGTEKEISISLADSSGVRGVSAVPGNLNGRASQDGNGNWVIDLGGLVAVKKVTLIITGTRKATNLAEISRVEFLNDMESRIPEPVMNIPTNLSAEPGNKSFALKWDAQTNVTGYEISIFGEEHTETRRTTSNSVSVSQFNGKPLENGKTYTVCVQSTNGEWKSGYSVSVPVTPKADKVPDAPENITVTGSYRSISVRWKSSKEADSYNLFWREKGASAYEKVTGIEGLYYQIENLKDQTTYEVYLTAVNEIGESGKSRDYSGETLSGLVEAKLPAYKLINTSNGRGKLSSHIRSASIGGGGTMVDSPLDKEKNSALGLFDNSYTSYVERKDWDFGGAYPDQVKGVTAELDQTYSIGMIAFAEPLDLGSFTYFTVQYWDESGAKKKASGGSISQRSDGKRQYYMIKFQEPIHASKIQLGVGRYNPAIWNVSISEIRFYEYDSLEADINQLYSDDLHISLREDVTEKTLQELQDRLDTKDPVSGEYHPDRTALQKELDAAKKLLAEGSLGGVVQIDPNIAAARDSGISVGGLNGWQPLGVSAAAEEDLVVYVGKKGAKEGANASLKLVFTQYHAESGGFFKTVGLKVGRNEIKVPKLSSLEQEKGGALYVQYTGNNSGDEYAVRVSGGSRYPVLNLYGISGEERSRRIQAYVQELKTYQGEIEGLHKEQHGGSENKHVNYEYDPANCILNSTDIVTDQMMFSIPASQVWAGLGNDPVKVLDNSLRAMDGMMTLFYQHKGLTNSFAEGTDGGIIAKNHLPYQYLNIRYMRMFAGAFMYASGNHIGIEWNSTKGMMGSVPVVSTDKGEYQSGRYFGWGIAHEIGHEINQGAYAHAEVTNNYFSVLAQAKDTNDSVRFRYSEVFKKVTSGATGYASNVFTQLGMYWQLHLAYDRDYNYKTYGTYQEIFDNLFFARVDSYARDTGLAPAPKGVKLTLPGDRDQNLMRLASAAAERDLSEFFRRWGMVPNAETTAYVSQFEPETRAIYYADDTARVYEMRNGGTSAVSGKNAVTAKASVKGSEVTLTMTPSVDKGVLQGYEIVRVFLEQGQEKKEIAGFTQTETFTDQAAFAANHVIRYEVTAIDKCLYRSNTCRTNEVKIEGDGLQDKTAWSVSTNMASQDDSKPDGTEEDPCEQDTVSAAARMIDQDKSTIFTGTSQNGEPYVLLELHQNTEVSALRYQLSGGGKAISDYKIEISTDGKVYREVKKGTFRLKDGSETVYFENGTDPWICTYDARYVRLTASGQQAETLSIGELDLYGPSGDNIEFMGGGASQSIGRLASDYSYGNGKIPKGSIVFTGTFKGNPAYNVVVLYDENGEIVGGIDAEGSLKASQIILAPDPGNAMLGETSEGTWIYWIEEKTAGSAALPKQVRAELYRVDHALTNEGQRLVSDTVFVKMPGTLSSITLKN